MGYIGNEPTTGHFPVDNFTSSGGSTYTLAKAPASAGAIEVSVQGVLQPTTAYTVSGTTLTMAGVTSGVKIFVRHLGETLSLPTPADGSVTATKLAVNAVDGTKIAMGSDAQGDILYHGASDYTRLAKGTSGSALVMNAGATAPSWGGIGIIQMVDNYITNTASQTALANGVKLDVSGMTVAITPTSASSKILVEVRWHGEAGSHNEDMVFGLKRGSTVIGNAPTSGTKTSCIAKAMTGYVDEHGSTPEGIWYSFIDSPATTSATTYQAWYSNRHSSNTTLFTNRTVADTNVGHERMTSTMRAWELSSVTTQTNGS